MSIAVQVYDEQVTGGRAAAITLQFPSERVTVRELIRARVYQEVSDYNQSQGTTFRGLVQPTDTERALNGFKLRQPRQIDWKPQFEKAIAAYEANQVLVLVNDRQTESLDEVVELGRGVEVSFLKLMPLVGG